MTNVLSLILIALLLGPLPALAQEQALPAATPPHDKASPDARIRSLKERLREVERAKEQYRAYLKQARWRLEDLARQQREAERLSRELAPFLEKTVKRLETFVAGDLDYLSDERSRRLAFLRTSLTDYDVPPSERLRRVLEALRVEAAYGRSVEKTEEFIELPGKRVRVDLLRLGRLALFYRTPGGQNIGWRAAGDEHWRSLDPRLSRELQKALAAAQRQRAAELVRLPLGGTQP